MRPRRLRASTLSESATYICLGISTFTFVNKISFSADDSVNTLILMCLSFVSKTRA